VVWLRMEVSWDMMRFLWVLVKVQAHRFFATSDTMHPVMKR